MSTPCSACRQLAGPAKARPSQLRLIRIVIAVFWLPMFW
jgi:hypothetical protein